MLRLFTRKMIKFIPLAKGELNTKKYGTNRECALLSFALESEDFWQKNVNGEYADVCETLIIRAELRDVGTVFYYPVGKNVEAALLAVEELCKKQCEPFRLCCLDGKIVQRVTERYFLTEILSASPLAEVFDAGCKIACKTYCETVVDIKTVAEGLKKPVLFKTERLTVSSTTTEDDEAYYKLSIDDDLNALWGYDYREDLGDNAPTKEYFSAFRDGMRDRGEEFSFMVKRDGAVVGELVVWNLGFYGDVEIGFRFFKEEQGKGYAFESAAALLKYLKSEIGVKTVKDRASKKNAPSIRLIGRLGFVKTHEDEQKNYYKMDI